MTAVAVPRRGHGRHLLRILVFAPGAALAAWGWVRLGEPAVLAARGGPYRYDELAVMVAAGFLAWPLLVVAAVFGAQEGRAALVPRFLRRRYRHRHARDGAKSAEISPRLRAAVYFADRGRCAYCRCLPRRERRDRTLADLAVDHRVPWIDGGPTRMSNLATLCQHHNIAKSSWQPGNPGRLRPGSDAEKLARAIWHAEQERCRSITRRLRVAWALAA